MASALYQVALRQFRDTVKPQKDRDREVLNNFLRERECPEVVKQTAVELKEGTDGNYERDLGPIPKEWISNILGNIQRAIDIGDLAAKGGAESVGMAWMVVKLTLGAIQVNYELYNLFGIGLTTVTEIMTIIPHYDKTYDNRGKAGTANTDFMDALFSNMKDAYSATLIFCYTVKKHVRARRRDMLGHAIKDFFGVERQDFQTRLEAMINLKNKVIEYTDGAFQKKVFDKFAGLGNVVQELKKDLQNVNSFAETASRLREGQEEMWSKLGETEMRLLARSDTNKEEIVRAIKENIKPKTPWELAEARYDQLMKSLNPSTEPHAGIDGETEAGFGRTVIEHERFLKWKADVCEPPILMLVGKEGSGKTTYTSALSSHLSNESRSSQLVLSASGTRTESGDQLSKGLAYLLSTLMVQLLRHIHRIAANDEDADLLTMAMDSTRMSKTEKDSKPGHIIRRKGSANP